MSTFPPKQSTSLPPASEEAATDLERLYSLLGTSSLSRQQFVFIIETLKLPTTKSSNDVATVDPSLSDELFERLLQMCREAESIAMNTRKNDHAFISNSALDAGEINATALRCLYAYHPSYTTCRNVMDSAFHLTSYISNLFQLSKGKETEDLQQQVKSINRYDGLDRNGSIRLLQNISSKGILVESNSDSSLAEEMLVDTNSTTMLSSNETIDNDKLESVVDDMMSSHFPQSNVVKDRYSKNFHAIDSISKKEEKQLLNLEMIASSLLQYNKKTTKSFNLKLFFHGTLPNRILDPFHCNSDDFVATLINASLGHDVLNHHVLTSLSMGSWGGLSGSMKYLSYFMDAYHCYTSTFTTHLKNTISLIDQADPTGRHLLILEENAEEEQGVYDSDAIGMIQKLGLDPDQICGIPHKDLYVQCNENLRQLGHAINFTENDRLTKEQCHYIANPLVTAFETACDPSKGATAVTAISALYFGSELIVATLYSKLSAFLVAIAESKDSNHQCPLTKQHLAFFLLHMEMDVDHADKMKEIVTCLVPDEASRIKTISVVDTILKARVEFFDRFVETVFPPTGHGGEDSAKLYNKQSCNWVRKEPTCLSDFTGRPIVFEMCSPFISGAHVLDVGCGEGYGARKLVEMGAKRIVGIDISSEMIESANNNPNKSWKETYQICDAENIVTNFTNMPTSFGLVPGRMFEEGCFDLAIAIFLFNYTSISKMKTICEQVFQMLKPGGHFVFSVPHPGMLNAHSDKEVANNSTFSFTKGDVSHSDYFSLSDRKFAGVIRTLDGRHLNVKMLFKSISDYFETMNSIGFNVAKMHEARVLPEHVAAHPEFFASVKDSPLHIVFDVFKPQMCVETRRIPKAIKWSSFEKVNADQILTVVMPKLVLLELVNFTIASYNEGITEDTFSPTVEDKKCLLNVSKFATDIRNRLLYLSGAVHIKGFDLGQLGGKDNSTADTTGRAKLAYYILSSLIGKVDGRARGSLFDVIDKGLDTKADNVLFSVSRAEAPYHTDGASAELAYDGVGLLCINPSSEGGKLHLSNAASALESLRSSLPAFILNELFRPIPRDILENGCRERVDQVNLVNFSRSPDLLKLRIRHNAFPIYEEGKSGHNDLLRFRYMRQWIESGHIKGGITISPLLQLAMDALDLALENERVASIKMQAGDIIYCHNMIFAHARDAFTNRDCDLPRHKVRVWLQLRGLD